MAYYASTLNSMGKTDIFKIKLKEEKPYVVFKGKIINSFTRKALTDKKDYQITVNGLPKDSIKINYDSAKFEIHFPFGAKYSIIPSLKYYKGDTLYKDYSQVKEFKVDTGTLYLDPFKYVTVKGILIQANNGALLPYNESTVVYLDGQDIRTLPNLKADVQLLRSAFNVNLLWGKKYVLQYQSPKFETEADTLDLTNIQEFKEVQVQLKGTRIKEVAPVLAATVTGTVINQKTGKPLTGKSSFQIWVNESPNETTTYDPETGKYSLVLPLGNAYLLNPKLERFISTSEFINLTNEKVSIKIYKDLLLAPIEVGQAIRMENIFFASGKAILDPKSYPELDRFANILKENKFLKVEIAGHTDNVGDPAKNMQLSRWRARAVLLYLQDKGVPVEQATFNGYGQTKPVADNKTPKGRALNRRVEFVIKDID
jgi:outer membrane protein OmpA-like peptidoglycan-associated protein